MRRPGFTLDVSQTTPPIGIWRGNDYDLARFPFETKVVYPPEHFDEIPHLRSAIRLGLQQPTDHKPLTALLRPDARFTIVVRINGGSPYVRHNDPRRVIIEELLEAAAAMSVDNVHVVLARGVDRSPTPSERRIILGDRVLDSLSPHGLLHSHDVDDESLLLRVDLSKSLPDVFINRHVAEADVLAVVDLAPHVGARTPLADALGASTYRRILHESPTESDTLLDRIDNALHDKLQPLCVTAVRNNDTLPTSLQFTTAREQDWKIREHLGAQVLRRTPANVALRAATLASRGSVRTVSLAIGDSNHVRERTANLVADVYETSLDASAIVTSVGISPALAATPGGPVDPLLGYWHSLRAASSITSPDGIVLIHGALRNDRDPAADVPLDDFMHLLLSNGPTTRIDDETEERFAVNSWYQQLYRDCAGMHGLMPLQIWNDIGQLRSRLQGVIVIGGDPATVQALGADPATTLTDGLALAQHLIAPNNEPSPFIHLHQTDGLIASAPSVHEAQ